MKDRLFIGVWCTGIGYCDRFQEENGDYKKIAFLVFSSLDLEVSAPDSPLLPEIVKHAASIQARRGEEYEVTASGQKTILGYDIKETKEGR